MFKVKLWFRGKEVSSMRPSYLHINMFSIFAGIDFRFYEAGGTACMLRVSTFPFPLRRPDVTTNLWSLRR